MLAGCQEEGSSTGIFEADVLYSKVDAAIIRTDPTTYGFEIGTVRKGEPVKVLRRTDRKVRIGKTTDYWYYIQKDNQLKGWVYGGSLSRRPTAEAEEVVEGPDMVVVQANLPGIWWELNHDGSTGYRRLEFVPEGAEKPAREEETEDDLAVPGAEENKEVVLSETGKFQYFFGKSPGAIIEYRIDPRTRRINLKQESPVGQQFELIDLGEEFRLVSAKGDKKFTFKKGFETEEDPAENNAAPEKQEEVSP